MHLNAICYAKGNMSYELFAFDYSYMSIHICAVNRKTVLNHYEKAKHSLIFTKDAKHIIQSVQETILTIVCVHNIGSWQGAWYSGTACYILASVYVLDARS